MRKNGFSCAITLPDRPRQNGIPTWCIHRVHFGEASNWLQKTLEIIARRFLI
jgi:hypothetical protein